MKAQPNNSSKTFSFSAYKALLPLLLSVLIALYIGKDISWSLIQSIEINTRFIVFMVFAVLLFIIRDANYVFRLRLLTDRIISWGKLIQIVILWEFASAVTPSAFGGPIAAVFLLQKEKISLGKSTSIILITAFLDELIFIILLPVLYILVGANFFQINITCIDNKAFLELIPYFKSLILIVYTFLLIVYLVLFYGLFMNAKSLQKAYQILGNLPLINRWQTQLNQAGTDIVIASKEAKSKSINFWLQAIFFTFCSWSARYILAFFVIASMMKQFPNVLDVYSKLYFIRTLSILPLSPGGIGVAEISFLALLCQFIPNKLIQVATLIWRFLSYHIYLLMGVIAIPIYFHKNYS